MFSQAIHTADDDFTVPVRFPKRDSEFIKIQLVTSERDNDTQYNKALNLTRCCRAGVLVESVSSARQHRAG